MASRTVHFNLSLEEEMRVLTIKSGAIFSAAAAALLMTSLHAKAAIVTVSASTMTDAYMSWTPLPGNTVGGASGGGWSIPALDAAFDNTGTIATISPNTNIADSPASNTSTYWFIGGNVNDPGQLMDANLYAEVDNTSDLNWVFDYNVTSNTFQNPPMTYADAFIKIFAPGYNYVGQVNTPLNLGPGVLVANPLTVPGFAAGDIVQYGFEWKGPDLTDSAAAAAGSVVIGAVVPEPTTGMILLGLAGGCLLRRKAHA
jgi:PEP-CTERM motif